MKQSLHRLFGDGFRIFFLAAGVFGLLAAIYWQAWLGVHAFGGMVTEHSFAPPPHLWHAHEMIFGYAGAALGGFFLTAVPNWTGGQGRAARLHRAGRGAVAGWAGGDLDVRQPAAGSGRGGGPRVPAGAGHQDPDPASGTARSHRT